MIQMHSMATCSTDEDDDGDGDEENDKISRIKSTESATTYDDEESNILSSLFDGISTKQLETKENSKEEELETECNQTMKYLNVARTKSSSQSIILKTGLRQLDEIRIIFKERPLGIQVMPLNIHGFGAKISKITNPLLYDQGVREQMIITGLNNKDLL